MSGALSGAPADAGMELRRQAAACAGGQADIMPAPADLPDCARLREWRMLDLIRTTLDLQREFFF